jgi:hypothetical protein
MSVGGVSVRGLLLHGTMKYASLAVLVAACGGTGGGPNAVLADLPTFTIRLETTELVDADTDSDHRPTMVSIEVFYDEDDFVDRHGGCAKLPELAGTLDGARLDLVSLGADTDESECELPRLTTTLEHGIADDRVIVTLDDGQITAIATYDMVQARTAELLSHPDWRFRADDRLVLWWSHLADLPADAVFSVGFRRGADFMLLAHDFMNEEIYAQIPNPAVVTGDGAIELRFDAEIGTTTSCSGADRCTFRNSRTYAHATTIDP